MNEARKKHHSQLLHLSREAFENHEVTKQSADRWLIQRVVGGKRHSSFWTEVVSLANGGLLVHGDIDPVFFRGHYAGVETVRWGGNAGFEYMVSKVYPGEATRTTDDKVAIADLEELCGEFEDALRRAEEDSSEEINAQEQVSAICDGVRSIRNGEDLTIIKYAMYEAGVDGESLSPIGIVVDSRVYYAHAALQKLVSLLGMREVTT